MAFQNFYIPYFHLYLFNIVTIFGKIKKIFINKLDKSHSYTFRVCKEVENSQYLKNIQKHNGVKNGG
ncbi:MAG: hypothetical protein COS15_01455 [Caldiserica bacterium CG02_land_8_20_14_3_00_36_38]|nr:MAG: hypothetical protein COX13_01380 [Caldiserica bacterium CG23_combo_of_CG06-09_8_20_14_all_35_60]PIV56503.1 MAG: hypothetical protein COS15_01455 [Caldiserica bacterium CG02_land_8_20_14_3_00_36_38]PIW10542.1 MAG: hypothetical protein COW37_02915 [Caldiserica bacterium CG17_big_fil_post_rev_8_21_14_2_50_35_7]